MKNGDSYFQGIEKNWKAVAPEEKLPQLFAITTISVNSENFKIVVYTIKYIL